MKYPKLEGICGQAIKNNLCTRMSKVGRYKFPRGKRMQICKA